HTRFSRDWSSDVCSSDLPERRAAKTSTHAATQRIDSFDHKARTPIVAAARASTVRIVAWPRSLASVVPAVNTAIAVSTAPMTVRSEERRVGEEDRAGWPD